MPRNSNKPTLTEVYDIVTRVEDKLDNRLNSLEKRIATMENIGIKFDPTILVPKILSAESWIHDFRLTWKVVLSITVVISSLVTFLLSTFLRLTCLFGKCIG